MDSHILTIHNVDLNTGRRWPQSKVVRLGKRLARLDPRTLKLSKYIKALPTPPVQAGYVDAVGDWPMMLNDAIGDCTIACAGHMIEQWTTYAGQKFTASDAQILNAYEAVSGYTPNNPNSDQGAVLLDVLKYWRRHGIAGHKIGAFVSVDPKNRDEVKNSIELFGNCCLGIELPIIAQNPITGVNGLPVWSLPSAGAGSDGAPGSWGGHAVPLVGYGIDRAGNKGAMLVTWAQLFDVTWGFLASYCSEAYAVLSQDWIDRQSGQAPSGFDYATLQQDLAEITA